MKATTLTGGGPEDPYDVLRLSDATYLDATVSGPDAAAGLEPYNVFAVAVHGLYNPPRVRRDRHKISTCSVALDVPAATADRVNTPQYV